MDSRAALKLGLDMAEFISLGYLEDLAETDLFHRPAAGANHINWQIGHLIKSEHEMLSGCFPGTMPPLPAGFVDRYLNTQATSDDPLAFYTKAELLAVYRAQRAATLATMSTVSDSQLDEAAPEPFRSYAPTLGAIFSLQGSHWLMHAGQWAVIRRQLGRPPLF